MKILIVDDEIASRMKMEKIMGSFGDCESAENGEDALKIAMSDTPPDIILLDIEMPGIDGYEVCKKLKAESRTKDVPVIFLTAHTEIESITKGLQLGAVDYITKPFHKDEVKARVRTHLSLKKMRVDIEVKNITLEKQVKEIQEKTEELRQKDLQLIEMDRIAGIGTLAAGIAHEINNPLSFVKSSIGFLKKSLDKTISAIKYWEDKSVPGPILNEFNDHLRQMNFDHINNTLENKIDTINRGIERIMKIVNNLKKFSRVDVQTNLEVDLNQSIEEAIEILSTPDTDNMELLKEFAEIPVLECSPNEINQCVLHILKNAIDAVGTKNGTIKITTTYNEKEGKVTLQIIDNGAGMTPEVLRQAFNPFFTTKPPGFGTGIGLSLTERIIKKHGGKIDISSAEGKGTTVTIVLPYCREKASD